MTTEFGEFTDPGHQRDLSATKGGTSAKQRHVRQASPAGQIAMIAYNAEPSLDELLSDGAARLLMAADGVQEGALRELLGTVKQARQDALRRAALVASTNRDGARRTPSPEFRLTDRHGDQHLPASADSALDAVT